MKTALDPRHIKREKAIKALFGWSFGQTKKIKDNLARQVINSVAKIDKIINEAAPEWPIEQINKVDLAVLRLAIYELIIVAKEPLKVIIDEAVELGKKYGSEKSPSFINGALGAIINKKIIKKKQKSNGET
jgi:transcription antitermination factor NusB